MCELPLIRKLGLGDNFPRKLLFVQKCCIGIRLIGPNAVICILVVKSHVGNKILQGKVSEIMSLQEEISVLIVDSKNKE